MGDAGKFVSNKKKWITNSNVHRKFGWHEGSVRVA